MVLLARPAGRLLSARSPLLPKQHGARQYSIQAVVEHGCKGLPDYVALMPVACLDSLHSTGLPWFAAIPLSAVLIRSLLIYPLFQRPLREKLVARAQLQPLVDANMSIVKRILYRRTSKGTQKSMAHKLNLTVNSWRIRNRTQDAMSAHSRLYGHRLLMFLTTIVVSDGLRRMMGAKEGLLKFVLGPLDWTLSWLVPSSLTETSPGEAEVSVASPVFNPLTNTGLDGLSEHQGLSATEIAQDATSGLAQEASIAVAGHLNSAWFDPTLLTEGFSWCPDLTASDPTMLLPVVFSGTFLASIYFAPRIQGTVTGSKVDERAKPTNGQRIMMTVAMLSIIPALHMPTGLLLYFISNMVTNNLQSRWLTYTKPIHPAPTACKRPIRMQRFKEIPEEMLPNKARPNTTK
ncbi:unnamed protein product [Aureobasidium uvarum]|uniref:Mitochondrial inner membrane protein COX18 n=1 Tax=Aureobasidium uvarum TaxID=2773716 RepID=A0A9N8PUP3_9PEZI|nr:unnamed protein product [Aureobasidium uvarum]